MKKIRRVVITGTGVWSALGRSRAELFERLAAGECAVRRMPEWDAESSPACCAAPAALDENIVRSIDRKFRRSMGRAALYAALAARQAVDESGLSPELLAAGRCGCVVSSTMGSSSSIMEAAAVLLAGKRDEMPGMQFFRCVSHSSAFNVATMLGITGVQLSPCSACASALQSVGVARDLIAAGTQDVVIAGGSDEATPAVAGSFAQLFALAGSSGEALEPETASRPFDAHRTGLVCGEGAGIVVLEEYEHALRRGAPILAEVAGYATNCGGAHVGQSDAESIARCLETALADAGIGAAEVGYVSAHATATPAGDREEAAALRRVFGDAVPVSSLKAQLGHTLGASGTIELAAALEMMRRGILLPTRNLDEIADECAGLDHLRILRKAQIDIFVKNCIAFGGVNAMLVVRKTGEYPGNDQR